MAEMVIAEILNEFLALLFTMEELGLCLCCSPSWRNCLKVSIKDVLKQSVDICRKNCPDQMAFTSQF